MIDVPPQFFQAVSLGAMITILAHLPCPPDWTETAIKIFLQLLQLYGSFNSQLLGSMSKMAHFSCTPHQSLKTAYPMFIIFHPTQMRSCVKQHYCAHPGTAKYGNGTATHL